MSQYTTITTTTTTTTTTSSIIIIHTTTTTTTTTLVQVPIFVTYQQEWGRKAANTDPQRFPALP